MDWMVWERERQIPLKRACLSKFSSFFSKVPSSGHRSGRKSGCPVVSHRCGGNLPSFCNKVMAVLYIWIILQACSMLQDHAQESASAHRTVYRYFPALPSIPLALTSDRPNRGEHPVSMISQSGRNTKLLNDMTFMIHKGYTLANLRIMSIWVPRSANSSTISPFCR